MAVALGQVASPAFQTYAASIVTNAKALCAELQRLGHAIVSGGTDNHLILWDLRPHGLTGSKMERAAELAAITINKNSVPGDTSAINPSGVRLGTPALTTRGMGPEEMVVIAGFLHEIVFISLDIQAEKECKALSEFTKFAEVDERIAKVKKKAMILACQFPMPGYNNF